MMLVFINGHSALIHSCSYKKVHIFFSKYIQPLSKLPVALSSLDSRKGETIKKKTKKKNWTSKGKKAVFLSGKVSLLFVPWVPETASTLGENYQMVLEPCRSVYPSGIMNTHTWPSERQCGRTQDRERCYYFVCELLPDSARLQEHSPSAAG